MEFNPFAKSVAFTLVAKLITGGGPAADATSLIATLQGQQHSLPHRQEKLPTAKISGIDTVAPPEHQLHRLGMSCSMMSSPVLPR